MAKRGPRPKPVALKLAEGVRAGRIDAGAAPGRGAAEPPGHLSGEALAEWHRVVPELRAMRVLSSADAAALAIYCVAFERWLLARRDVDSIGVVVLTDAGVFRPNPAVAVAFKCESLMRGVLSSFGMDPSSRGHVRPVEDADEDPLAEFRGG